MLKYIFFIISALLSLNISLLQANSDLLTSQLEEKKIDQIDQISIEEEEESEILREDMSATEDDQSISSLSTLSSIINYKNEKTLDPETSQPTIKGDWFPDVHDKFKPFLADPRNLSYSIALRFHDDVFGKNISSVNFGEIFPLMKWSQVHSDDDLLQLGIELGAWAIFNTETVRRGDWLELINTDYYVGIPLIYSYKNIAFRFRLYHISAHLGDEYIVANPSVVRLNPSIEVVDAFVSFSPDESIRFYGGLGYIINSDETYNVQPGYFEYGAEWKLFSKDIPYFKLREQPFLAFHIRHHEDHNWNYDGTFRLGYEWSPMKKDSSRKWRTFIEFHEGFSLDGQFSKQRSNYMSVGMNLGY